MSLPIIRRVITGHDVEGTAIVKIDEICSHFREGRPGAKFATFGQQTRLLQIIQSRTMMVSVKVNSQ